MDIKKSVVKLFSGRVVVTLIEFVAVVGFTRSLGAGAIGSYFVYRAVIGMLGIPVDLGISTAVEKRISAEEPLGEVISTAVVVKLFLILPWLVVLLVASSYVEWYIGIEGIILFVLIGLLANQGQRLMLRLLAGQLRVEQNALLTVMGKLVWVCSGFVLILVGWGAEAIIMAFVLGDLTTIFGALIRADLAIGWPRLKRARDLINFGRYVFIGDVGGFIYQWMDVAILRLFVPVSLIGAYEIAWRVASVSMMLTEAIRRSLFPQISRWYSENRINEIESAFYRWLQVPLYLTIPAFAGAVILGEDILGTLFGADVTAGYPVLIIFMLEKILRSVQLVIGPSLFAMDKPHLGYRGSVAAIMMNLTLNLTLIPIFGLIGAAIATTVSAATAAFIAINYVTDFVSIEVPWSRIGWSAISAILMAGIVELIRTSISTGWLRIMLGVGVGVTIYFIFLLANEGIRVELQGIIEDYRGTIH